MERWCGTTFSGSPAELDEVGARAGAGGEALVVVELHVGRDPEDDDEGDGWEH